MRILVFGSTGGVGRGVVSLALAQGHAVTAFARTPDKLQIAHPNLQVVQGDVMDPVSVERAVPGHDVVLSALGAGVKRSTVRSQGTRHIVLAMEKAGVRRLVALSSLGVGDSRGNLNLLLKHVIVPLVLRHGFADHAEQERHIRQSRLDWIIVRPGSFTRDNARGVYRHGFPPTDTTTKLKIARVDVADFMLKQVSDDTYLHQTPGISY